MERGYQATAFTHGSYYTLSVDMLFVLMRRQQYAARCKKVVRRILKLRLKSLMLYFYRLTVTLAEVFLSSASCPSVLRSEKAACIDVANRDGLILNLSPPPWSHRGRKEGASGFHWVHLVTHFILSSTQQSKVQDCCQF